MGLIGLVAEIVVFGCLIAASKYIIGFFKTCEVIWSVSYASFHLFCIFAVVTNILLTTSCELFKVTDIVTMGLFRYSVDNVDGGDCQTIDDDDENQLYEYRDAALNCGRVCSILALCFGAVLVLCAIIKQFLCPLPLAQKLIDISGTLVQIMLALVYVAWRTGACQDFGCEWGQGATMLVVTQLLYLAASIFTRCMREPRYERRKNEPKREAKKEGKKEADEPEPEQEEGEIEVKDGDDDDKQ
jgi:hypothetical protein